MKSHLGILSPADYFSIANGAIGALGILYFIDGKTTHTMVGIALICIAIFMDGLDGAIARRFGSKHNLGIYIDSLADSVSFCFAPAVFVYMVFYDIGRGTAFEDLDNFLAVAATISIATVGIVRLSIFTYFKENRLENFLGLPTPAVAFFVLTSGILFRDHPRTLLPVVLLVTVLMLMNVPYPKIDRKWLVPPALIALLSALIGAIMGAYELDHHRVPFALAFIFIILYIGTPLFARLSGRPIARTQMDDLT
jgi:archaetidylserine synthase